MGIDIDLLFDSVPPSLRYYYTIALFARDGGSPWQAKLYPRVFLASLQVQRFLLGVAIKF